MWSLKLKGKEQKNKFVELLIPTQWIFMGDKLFWAKNVWGGCSKWEDYWSDHAKVEERSFINDKRIFQ